MNNFDSFYAYNRCIVKQFNCANINIVNKYLKKKKNYITTYVYFLSKNNSENVF